MFPALSTAIALVLDAMSDRGPITALATIDPEVDSFVRKVKPSEPGWFRAPEVTG
jgi:hypothetical protein